jgi:hypothetical protein
MPRHHGFWVDDDEGFPPTRPQLADGTGLLPFEDGQLLAKGSGLQSESVARHKESSEVGDYGANEHCHQFDSS